VNTNKTKFPWVLVVGALVLVIGIAACGALNQTRSAPSPATLPAATTQPTPTAATLALPSVTAPARASAAAPTPTPVVLARLPTAVPAPSATPKPKASPTAIPAKIDGLKVVTPDKLPPEARTTLQLVIKGGPFPYDRDGVVYQNRERVLPAKASGYYHEYTVVTPGSADRGARRIVAGGKGEFYYTDDHYASFVRVIVPGN
jgi:ribonuclease T1